MTDLDSDCDLSSSNDDERFTQSNLHSDIIEGESFIFEQEHDSELMPLLTL